MTALLALLATVAAPTAALPPSGKWIVNYDKELCVASRDYGTGAQALTIAFRPFPTQPRMDVVVLDHASASRFESTGSGAVVLAPGGERVAADWHSFGIGDGRRIVHMSMERDALARMASTQALTLELGKRAVAVQVPSMKAALAALDTCEQNLMNGWGVDPALFKTGVEPPKAKGSGPASWFGPDAYPPEALAAHVQGRAVALVQIDGAGKVTQCRIVESSRNAALDGATCGVMQQRARYLPARAPSGEAVASWSLVPVRWLLPNG